ncbi:hypothetical protein JCM10450v2_002911 [Rhodotorula kratochvilovae]
MTTHPVPPPARHVDDALLTKLRQATARCREEDELDPWQDLYDKAWGRPNGGLHGTIPIVALSVPGYDPNLIARDEYAAIFEWRDKCEVNLAADMDKRRRYPRLPHRSVNTVLFGQPGIGKSSFLPYAVARLAEQRRPFVFHRIGFDQFVILFCAEGVFLFRPANLKHWHFLVPLTVLLDSTPGSPAYSTLPHFLELPNALVFFASSTQRAGYEAFEKSRFTPFYYVMRPPGLEELRNIVAVRSAFRLDRPSNFQYHSLAAIVPGRETPQGPVTGGRPFDASPYTAAFVSSSSASTAPVSTASEPSGNPASDIDLSASTRLSSVGTLDMIAESDDEPVDGGYHDVHTPTNSPARKELTFCDFSALVADTSEYTPEEIFELAGPSLRSALQYPPPSKSTLVAFLEERHLGTATTLGALKHVQRTLTGALSRNDQPPSAYYDIFTVIPVGEQPQTRRPSYETVIVTPLLRLAGAALASHPLTNPPLPRLEM